MDQPSYRIKHEKDGMSVTKEDSYYEDEGETDYYRKYWRNLQKFFEYVQ